MSAPSLTWAESDAARQKICNRLGCAAYATISVSIDGVRGRWYGCAPHAALMAKAVANGKAIDTYVHTDPIRRRR